MGGAGGEKGWTMTPLVARPLVRRDPRRLEPLDRRREHRHTALRYVKSSAIASPLPAERDHTHSRQPRRIRHAISRADLLLGSLWRCQPIRSVIAADQCPSRGRLLSRLHGAGVGWAGGRHQGMHAQLESRAQAPTGAARAEPRWAPTGSETARAWCSRRPSVVAPRRHECQVRSPA